MKLNIITRCTKPYFLPQVKKSINFNTPKINIKWHIIFDTSVLKDIDASLLKKLNNKYTTFYFIEGKPGDLLYPQSMEVINQINEGFIYYLDDDNLLHPYFLKSISTNITEDKIYVVDQFVNFKDFTNKEYRIASPENMKLRGVDVAQLIFPRSIFDSFKWKGDYCADGLLVEEIMFKDPNYFRYINETLSYYNYLVEDKKPLLPKVLYIGPNTPEFTTRDVAYGVETRLETQHLLNEDNLIEKIQQFNPHVIAVQTEDDTQFPILENQSREIKNKWISFDKVTQETGDDLHYTLMTNILKRDNSYLVSWFTPIHNTGEVLKRTYESLKNQTYKDWEWVITNDSSDGGKTLKIAEEIAKNDLRVKVFDIKPRTKGVVGDSKYRAASLCKGYILAELDHDDYLTPDATELLVKASHAHPDAGFFWTDSAEVDENWEPMWYEEPFCYDYGTYRTEKAIGKTFTNVVNGININPKTIRHIVGIPNHIRAWRKEVYQYIGGHNRNLSVADDYELIVRTFLATRMVRIPKLCYLQFIAYKGNNVNTQHGSRAEIQRLSNSIAYYYNEAIRERFEQLGYHDWGYYFDPNKPYLTPSRFGDEECAVNYTYKLNK
jgi:glycosyltransferase involved in cell wall biosynthesis